MPKKNYRTKFNLKYISKVLTDEKLVVFYFSYLYLKIKYLNIFLTSYLNILTGG